MGVTPYAARSALLPSVAHRSQDVRGVALSPWWRAARDEIKSGKMGLGMRLTSWGQVFLAIMSHNRRALESAYL